MGGRNWIFKRTIVQGVLEVRIQAAQRCTVSFCLDGKGHLGLKKTPDISFFTSKPSETFRPKEKYVRGKDAVQVWTGHPHAVANCNILFVGKSPKTKEV